jgi:hypothetical protein
MIRSDHRHDEFSVIYLRSSIFDDVCENNDVVVRRSTVLHGYYGRLKIPIAKKSQQTNLELKFTLPGAPEG